MDAMNDTNLTGGGDPEEEYAYHRNFLLHTRFWVQRILVPSIMTVGLVGNAITIAIMTRRRMRSSTNYYLAALATFDATYLVLTFVLSLSHYPRVPDPDHRAYWRLRPFVLMLTDTCSNTSVWLTVTFTVERYVAVCYPMKGKVLCTESRAKRAIVAVFLFCFAFTIPTPFEWQVVERVDPISNRTTLALDHSDMGRNYLYRTIYYWLTVVFFIFVPFVLLAIFNSFLIRSVHLSKVQRSSMTRGGEENNTQENKITIMLIAVVILFFVCQLPTACHLLYSTLHEDFDKRQLYLLSSLGNIFNFLMSVNSAGNFVLYCLLSQKYRRTFVQIFCPCLFEKRTGALGGSVYYQTTTMVSDADTDSPGSRRSSNVRVTKLSSSSCENSPAGTSRTVFLQVPKYSSTKVVYDDDDDLDSLSDRGSSSSCVRCKKIVVAPWRHLKESMGGGKKTREQVIPLKGGGNKCIVITAPEGMPNTSQWSSNSAV